MPKVSIVINRSSEIIWDYFTKPENWKKWWGASILSVNPGWQNGAKITWENGDRSDLLIVKDQQEMQISSLYMKTALSLRPKSEQTTLLEYYFNACGGASFSDDGRAHQTTVEKKLAKLKDCLENETADNSNLFYTEPSLSVHSGVAGSDESLMEINLSVIDVVTKKLERMVEAENKANKAKVDKFNNILLLSVFVILFILMIILMIER